MLQHEAFLAQARSDFAVFEGLLARPTSEVPACHALHYLQMATEKLARAFLEMAGETLEPHERHRAFTRLADVLATRADVLRAIGYAYPDDVASFLRRAIPVFQQVEHLCPAVANGEALKAGLSWDQGPNVEYPWWTTRATGETEWHAPAAETFAALATVQRLPDGLSMMRLIRLLLTNFDRIC